ncbi:MAG: hypothetical protein OXD49_14220 [Candidatus Poribacteria bacterium]|nr:hypothetical protein [Candidatus Poribacteria bacterium]
MQRSLLQGRSHVSWWRLARLITEDRCGWETAPTILEGRQWVREGSTRPLFYLVEVRQGRSDRDS